MLLQNYKTAPQYLIDYWKYQANNCTDRNKDWFQYIHEKKFLLYTVIKDGNNIVSFSCIQEEGFPNYTCRIGTRSFIDPKYRNYSSSLEQNKQTPLFMMLRAQYEWVKENTDKENCFASMEFNKTAALKSSAKKFKQYWIDASVLKDRYKMIDNENNPSCFQSVMFFKISSERFDLKKYRPKEDYLIELNQNKLDIDWKELALEVVSLNYSNYGNFYNNIHATDSTTKWMMETTDWKACDVNFDDSPECKKWYEQLSNILNCKYIEVQKPRALFLKSGVELVKHTHYRVPGQNHLSINYIASIENGPVNFTKYGNIDYDFAILNTVEQHSVPPSKHDRYLIGLPLRYTEDTFNWKDVKDLISEIRLSN